MAFSHDTNYNILLSRFEQQLMSRNLQRQTIHAYVTDANQFLAWLEETQVCPPEMVSPTIARAYLDYLATPTPHRPAGYAANTITRKLKSLRYFYDSLD